MVENSESLEERSSIRTVSTSGLLGTMIEWYDFYIFGTAAALIFNQLFFPEFSATAGTLAAFAVFASGWLTRPLGGIVFGHYGDRIGRKNILVLTLVLMGVSTFLIGLLPTFASVGILAPILLTVLRLVQGFAVGGEWGGAVLMVAEHSPPRRRGFYTSFPQIGSPLGLLLSTGIFAIFASLPDEQFLSWGWRIPFLFSIVLVVIGLFIRLKITESPAFKKVRETSTVAQLPVVEAVKKFPKNILVAIGSLVVTNVAFYIFATFSLTYVTQELSLSRGVILSAIPVAAAIEALTIPLFAALSDRIGRRTVLMGGAAFLALYAFPFFWLLNTRSPTLILVALVIGLAIGQASVYGTQASFFVELFSTRVRYTAASLSYQIAGALVGGLTPFLATALLLSSNGGSWSVSLYLIGAAAITFIALCFAPETFRTNISEEEDLALDREPERTRAGEGARG